MIGFQNAPRIIITSSQMMQILFWNPTVKIIIVSSIDPPESDCHCYHCQACQLRDATYILKHRWGCPTLAGEHLRKCTQVYVNVRGVIPGRRTSKLPGYQAGVTWCAALHSRCPSCYLRHIVQLSINLCHMANFWTEHSENVTWWPAQCTWWRYRWDEDNLHTLTRSSDVTGTVYASKLYIVIGMLWPE